MTWSALEDILYRAIQAQGNQSAFVHPDNLVPLKLAILRHLPVLVFNAEKEFEQKDAAITLTYFDNEDLELHLSHVRKTEGEQSYPSPGWYGDTDVKTASVLDVILELTEQHPSNFMERQTHRGKTGQARVEKGKKTRAEVESRSQLAQAKFSIVFLQSSSKAYVFKVRGGTDSRGKRLPQKNIRIGTKTRVERRDFWTAEAIWLIAREGGLI
ncbi:uncharacterized protein F5891DRAFT_986856 [Suillus fuscotomentosus]|uniref:VTC domain-containing protein n=1 Tax=Suillus fuscotomentosus TaxID=1912939 RepID=A0AAD4DR25_9AGAM|nr:uncharacterized protein F5891DRAFT_986856 [Suillus fuscotomentosus]KAG1890653.1 hypothetical protein F5891DRAFT_986856 [Suillus fuscotomentosus]